MTGVPFIIVFAFAIVLMIVMISKWRIHPFISIMLVAVGLGLIGGIPLVNKIDDDGETILSLPTSSGRASRAHSPRSASSSSSALSSASFSRRPVRPSRSQTLLSG